MKSTVLVVALVFLAGCGEPADEPEPAGEVSLDGCRAPDGLGSPQSIDEALTLLNALPSPVSVPCVIQSLDRPLGFRATRGTVSAQPALSEKSPRIFLLNDHLTLSIVPDGRGRELLEFGESDGNGNSLKGELNMPIATPVTADKPYDHLRYNEHVTVCGLCHRDEVVAPEAGHANAYLSRAFKPLPQEVVDVDDVRAEWEACDPEVEPDRCAMLGAIFDHGPVEERLFPENYGTIVRP